MTAKALRRTEQQEIREITGLAEALGMRVCSTQQFRPSKQAVGLPDLWVFDVARTFEGAGTAFWWEAKAEDGVLSIPQQAFRADCAACRVSYGVGTLGDFAEFVEGLRGFRRGERFRTTPPKWRGKLERLV